MKALKTPSLTSRSFLLVAGLVSIFGGSMSFSNVVAASSSDPLLTLWYDKPAEKWIEALPVGNGRLGAMIFGGTANERLVLNDITVWSGGPQPEANRTDGWKFLPEIRKAMREGRYGDADKLVNEHLSCTVDYDKSRFQALGDLKLDFILPTGETTDYRRWLDIDRALAGVEFKAGGATFTREMFSSAPDKVLVQRIAASKPKSVSFALVLSRSERAQTRFVAPDTLVMTGNTGPNLDYEVHLRVLTKGGTVTGGRVMVKDESGAEKEAGDQLRIDGADEAVILLTAATSYVADFAKGYKGADPALAAQQMKSAAAKDYGQLKTAHIADYQKLFQRVSLDLGTTEAANKPTDERLEAFHKGASDPALATLFYQFGRYLLISSSRPENPLPANLQGIWAENMKTPWNGDYTININAQMNYWPAEITNLSELHLPLLRHIQTLVAPGINSAKATFGPDTPGWATGHKSNAWGWASSGEKTPWVFWFGANGWLCQHLWEHYAFTGDKDYLRGVYPIIKGASEFWLATLVEGADGKLIPSPSSSPENWMVADNGKKSSIDEGTAIDKAIVWELFDNTARAGAALGVDADFQKKLLAARDRLRPQQIGKAGQLMEWSGDWDLNAENLQHRHPSHLYALHPGTQITLDGTPELAAAARKSLELRGDGGTGWSRAWKINLWARLRDGDHAYKLLTEQLTPTRQTKLSTTAGGTYPNLFDAHPPFQIDGNFGATAGVTEMLLQSQQRYNDPSALNENRYIIDLLPALPKIWPNGSVKGLRARGGAEVSIAWKDGKLSRAEFRSEKGSVAKIRYNGKTVDLKIPAGGSLRLGAELNKL